MDDFPIIVVGTYEEFVLGYTSKTKVKNSKFELHQIFATHSHQASVRCLAANGQLMASSGADEYINIYDMVNMEISTVLNYHDSTVTCLEFTSDNSHLITTNQNGDIAIFRCKDWTLVKFWKGAHKHSNGILSISTHPSGSLLITTGADNILRFWNLVKGRQAYAINFSKKCSVGNFLNFGMWSNTGNYFVVSVGSKLEVYKTVTAAVVYEASTNSRATCCVFTKKNLICIGTEEGFFEVHSIKNKKLVFKKKVHNTRVKCAAHFSLTITKNDESKTKNYIVSGDSKGNIKVWFLKKKGLNYFLNLLSEVDCDCRITSLTLVFPKNVKQEKHDLSSQSLECNTTIKKPEVKNNDYYEKEHNNLSNTPLLEKKFELKNKKKNYINNSPPLKKKKIINGNKIGSEKNLQNKKKFLKKRKLIQEANNFPKKKKHSISNLASKSEIGGKIKK